MHIEFKNLCNASKHMNMHISNANNQCSWACSPYLCASLLSKNFDPSSFLLMLLPCPCPSLISPPWNISFVVQLIPWSYLCSNFSPFVINFHKRYVIPIKSLDTNCKKCESHCDKGLHWDRWLRLESCIFDGHHHMCWNDITWIALEIPHRIFDLDTIWWGTPPMS